MNPTRSTIRVDSFHFCIMESSDVIPDLRRLCVVDDTIERQDIDERRYWKRLRGLHPKKIQIVTFSEGHRSAFLNRSRRKLSFLFHDVVDFV